MHYAGKEISEHNLEDLLMMQRDFARVMVDREKASQHEKFTQDVELPDGRVRKKMEFPPPNPKFIELMKAVDSEIKMRTGK